MLIIIQNNHNLYLQLSTDEFSVLLGAERLGTLDRSAKSAVDNELWQNTEGARDTKENGVKTGFSQAVILQKDTRVRINVGIWVLRL